jgi:general stress protein 26
METDEHARQDALSFLKQHKAGVLATIAREYNIHASMVYYTADDDFNIYFITQITSRKFEALSEHPQVAFTIASAEVPQTLQIEGMAMDISLDDDEKEKKDKLFEILHTTVPFYAPLAKLDPAELVMVWIRPTWIRWSDYAFEETGNRHIFKEISITK